MQRPIKYRAWHKRHGMSFPGEEFEPIYGMQVFQGSPAKDFDGEEFILMQFTGLRDRNGAEIWEGDVVKWGGSMGGVGQVVYEGYSFIVKYRLGGVEDTMYFNHPDAYEVIGNIHEHPELLEGK